ncbi:hypothetical protein BGZ94_005647 [Podila epigama]|nr:hypothetical protein BGZ94_005647 [Podila epigama]
MAFSFPSLIPTFTTIFSCNPEHTLTSPTSLASPSTLSLLSSFCQPSQGTLDGFGDCDGILNLTSHSCHQNSSPPPFNTLSTAQTVPITSTSSSSPSSSSSSSAAAAAAAITTATTSSSSSSPSCSDYTSPLSFSERDIAVTLPAFPSPASDALPREHQHQHSFQYQQQCQHPLLLPQQELQQREQQQQQQQRYGSHSEEPSQLTTSEVNVLDDTLLEQIFEIEKLKLLMELTDHDIEQFHLHQQRVNTPKPMLKKATMVTLTTNALPATTTKTLPQLTPSSEIKRLDEKEPFVHPGFYTLPSTSSPKQTDSPQNLLRKRSLQEDSLEVNRLRALSSPGEMLRRHSVEGSIVSPLMQSHPPSYSQGNGLGWASSYATPPKTPSTPSTAFYAGIAARQNMLIASSFSPGAASHAESTDVPPGQPFVLASYPPPLNENMLPSMTSQRSTATTAASTLLSTSTTPYPPPRPEATSSSYPTKKRKTSKLKMDPFQFHSHNRPLPFEHAQVLRHDTQPQHLSQHQARPFPPQQHAPDRPHALPFNKVSPTHRHNPAQVPASLIPPDHFVFREALLLQQQQQQLQQQQQYNRQPVKQHPVLDREQPTVLTPTGRMTPVNSLLPCPTTVAASGSSHISASTNSSTAATGGEDINESKKAIELLEEHISKDHDSLDSFSASSTQIVATAAAEAAAFAQSLTTIELA